MGDPTPISFGQGSKQTRYGLEGTAEFINAYLEDLGDDTKTGFSAYAINGLDPYATLVNGQEIRGMLAFDSELLVISGRNLFSIDLNGNPTLKGGLGVDGFFTLERNRRSPAQAVIVASGSYFVYSGGVLTAGADPDLTPPIAVIQKDGFFVFLHSTGKWSISAIDDVTIDPLAFNEAQSNADGLVMGAVRGPDVILFGDRSAEFWQNTGAVDFPFTRSMAINMGCWCAGSVKTVIVQVGGNLVDSVIWAATDKDGAFAGVYVLNGFTPSKISTDEVDRLIRDEPNKDVIRSMAWSEDGHVFYSISGSAWTRTFDTRTARWHTRKSGSNRWRVNYHAFFAGKHIFGDSTTNLLYASNPGTFTDAGTPIDWSITTPIVHTSPYRFRVNGLHIGALTGVGAVSGADANTDPVLMLDYSRDGGKTFGAMRNCKLGKAAQRNVRIKERAFGRFDKNGVAWRMQCSANVIKGLLELAIDFDKLAA